MNTIAVREAEGKHQTRTFFLVGLGAALIMRCPFWVWQILDTLMYGVIYACLWKLMKVEDRNSIFLAMAVCSYIFLQMASAGWQITSVIYVGTMAAALVCGVIQQKSFENGKTGIWEYVLYSLCMLYTCNYEIMAVTMLLGSVLLLQRAWKASRWKKVVFYRTDSSGGQCVLYVAGSGKSDTAGDSKCAL